MTSKLLNIKSTITVFILFLSFLHRMKKKAIATHQSKKFDDKKFFRRWADFIPKNHPIYGWRSQTISYSIYQIPKKSTYVPRFSACQISSPEIFSMSHQPDINRRCRTISFILTPRSCSFINLPAILRPRCVRIKVQRYTIMSQILVCINIQKSSEYEKLPQLLCHKVQRSFLLLEESSF